MAINWLPPLVLLEQFDGDQDQYIEALYGHFCADFMGNASPMFRGLPVRMKRHPIKLDKEATFWHFITEGPDEANRQLNIRRCERIRWPKAMMDNVDDADLKVWEQEVKSEIRTHVWCEEHEYLVVIANRSGFVLPWTGYHVVLSHEKQKLQKRWQTYR